MEKIFHESAAYHITGEAIYLDDIPQANVLIGHLVGSKVAKGKIISTNIEQALKVKGIHAILSHKDILGINNLGPIVHDEEALAVSEVRFVGQAIFLIAAETKQQAIDAERLIEIVIEEQKPVFTLFEAMSADTKVQPTRTMKTGEAETFLPLAEHKFSGNIEIGGQEHWYLETQASLCIPGEGNEMKIISSTQNPTEVQMIVAENLGVSIHEVEVETRRLGGGFGGKETNAHHVATWAAILAKHCKQPVKIKLTRDEDQKITGKRHPYFIEYQVGFTQQGIIQAIEMDIHSNAGSARDLSMSILERSMLHAENAYFVENMTIRATAWKTNLPSNTAFRGFGAPQSMAAMENIIDEIARFLSVDAAEIRYKNFYGIEKRNKTPYGQLVINNRLFSIWDELIQTSDYYKRRKEIQQFNAVNTYLKKGLAITPVKFGISFTTSFLNQAGALVNIYTDGTILVNHGGVEMGQGLFTKMQQIAALELGVSLDKIKVNATNTSKVPNTSPTAASSGSDLNGAAVKEAILKLKERIQAVVANYFSEKNQGKQKSEIKDIIFRNNLVFDWRNPEREISFAEAASIARIKQVSLSATGFYKTPDINYNRETETGNAFHYFAFGMAVSEVSIDILTGECVIERSDILHDVGESINPNIDIGQIEGAFVQGLGWVTSEEMKYSAKGELLNYSPDTYKIPGIRNIPKDFRVSLLQNAPNFNAIRRSKAVGEPPFMLALSVWFAIKDALLATSAEKKQINLKIPATNEAILLTLNTLNK